MSNKILFATSNKGKLREIREILSGLDCEVLSLADAGITSDVEENGSTFAENAHIKAEFFAKESGLITLADDSGLEVDYMNKEPGIYSARFLGRDTSYDIKNHYIIGRLAEATGDERSARFVCAICCVLPDGRSFESTGVVEGVIATRPRGENGFGYDPIFYVPEYGCTTAELPTEKKNEISHRGRALRKMREILESEGVI